MPTAAKPVRAATLGLLPATNGTPARTEGRRCHYTRTLARTTLDLVGVAQRGCYSRKRKRSNRCRRTMGEYERV